jgi:GlpG protein
MMWLRTLGTSVERAHATWFLLLLVVVAGIISNATQFFATFRPNFGGMSGVVYALLGYAWIRGKYDPTSGLHVPKHVTTMMLIWFAMGFLLNKTGSRVQIANWAHAGGLVVGVVWGYLSSGHLTRRRRRP